MGKLKKYTLIATFLIVSAISFQAISQENGNNNWIAPKEADEIVNPLKGNEEATKAGKVLFQQQCVVCHGTSGKGDGAASVALNPKPANFTSKKVQNETDGAIFWKITTGRPPMISYKDLLIEEQRWQLVNYIRTFSE
ncbi:cytochrome c [Carboxylicivirga sp. A043]|uniref:c-type cytochrome n=1 Tax=Carboxylicivirga litoralis TaxID=2816963 RepID=UPI0021CB11CD|nr:cytochrome c [Carboxylicivirga sp. A043]MCU4158285.1 cytochrome c [Carboxylicivirga sp. A043]